MNYQLAPQWELIHEETREGFSVRLYVTPETDDPEGAFDDNGETAAAIRAGEYEWFIARVTASRNGIVLADDYLGGCCYETYQDFVRPDEYYADMRRFVIAEAREILEKLTEESCIR